MASAVLLAGLGSGIFQDQFGNAITGRGVFVYERATNTQVQVYADAALSVPLNQPLVTGSTGQPGAVPGYVSAEQSIDFVDATTGARTQGEAVSAVDVGLAGGGSVDTVFGRSGAVTAQTGDYAVTQVTGAAPLNSPAFTGSPTAPTPIPSDNSADIATTAYVTLAVQAVQAGLQVHQSVNEATAGALPANTYDPVGLTLTANGNGALTVDGVSVSLNDRVLVKNEATAADNGLYTVTATGDAGDPYVLTRASDMNTGAEVPGAFVFVETGTVNTGAGFAVVGAGPFTLGITAITWTQFSGAGELTAGTAISIVGNQIGVNLGTTSTTAAAGNDSRITGALQASNNLSDVAAAATARSNLGLGTSATASIDATASDFKMDGTAAAGSTGKVADAGHVHPTDTSRAPLASPALTGNPTAPTQTPLTDSTRLATTAYTDAAVGVETTRAEAAEVLLAPIASPTFTGAPKAPTQAPLDNSTKLATTAYTDSADALLAPLVSPTFTGAPQAPTQAPLDDSTKLATTAYTDTAVAAAGGQSLASSPNLGGRPTVGSPVTTVSGAGQQFGPVALVRGSQTFPGPTSLNVESTSGFPGAGSVVTSAGTLAYAGTSNAAFTGISSSAGSGTVTSQSVVSLPTTLVVASTAGFPASGWVAVTGITNPVFYGSIQNSTTFAGCYTVGGSYGTATNGGAVYPTIPVGMDSGNATGNTQIATTASVIAEKLQLDVRDFIEHGDQGIMPAISRAYNYPGLQFAGGDIVIPRGKWSLSAAIPNGTVQGVSTNGLAVQPSHGGRVTIKGEGTDSTTLQTTFDVSGIWNVSSGAYNNLFTLFGIEDLTLDATQANAASYQGGVLVQANGQQINLTKFRVRNVNVINAGNPAAHSITSINISSNSNATTPASTVSVTGVPTGMYIIQDIEIDNCELGLIGGGGTNGVIILSFYGSDESQGASTKYSNPITSNCFVDQISVRRVRWDAYPGTNPTGSFPGAGIQLTGDGISGHQEIHSCWLHGSNDDHYECDAPYDLTITDSYSLDPWNEAILIANNYGSTPMDVALGQYWQDPDAANIHIENFRSERINSAAGSNPSGITFNGRFNTILPNVTFNDVTLVDRIYNSQGGNPLQILGRAPRKITGSVNIVQKWSHTLSGNSQSVKGSGASIQLPGRATDLSGLHIYNEVDNTLVNTGGFTGCTYTHYGVQLGTASNAALDLGITTSAKLTVTGASAAVSSVYYPLSIGTSNGLIDTFSGDNNVVEPTVSGSGQVFPTTTLNLNTTSGLPASGNVNIPGVTGAVQYQGYSLSPAQLTGCVGGTGTATNSGTVTYTPAVLATDYLLDAGSLINVISASNKAQVAPGADSGAAEAVVEERFIWLQNNAFQVNGQIGPQMDSYFACVFTPGATISGHKGGIVSKWLDGQVPQSGTNSWLEAYVTDNGSNSIFNLDKIIGGIRTNLSTTTLVGRIAQRHKLRGQRGDTEEHGHRQVFREPEHGPVVLGGGHQHADLYPCERGDHHVRGSGVRLRGMVLDSR